MSNESNTFHTVHQFSKEQNDDSPFPGNVSLQGPPGKLCFHVFFNRGLDNDHTRRSDDSARL
jgi:hypothetical protein